MRNQFNHCRVQLILVTLRRSAPFEVAHIATLVGDDERTFELSSILRVDAEVCAQLDWTAHTLRDVHKRSIAKHSGIQRGVEVVAWWYDTSDILTDQLWMLAQCLADRTKDDAEFLELVLEGRLDTDTIEHDVDGYAREDLLLLERYAQLFERGQKLWINFVERSRTLLLLRSRPINDVLKINARVRHIGPARLLHRLPLPEGLQTPFEHPLRLFFFCRNEPHDVLTEALRQQFLLNIRCEAILVVASNNVVKDGLV